MTDADNDGFGVGVTPLFAVGAMDVLRFVVDDVTTEVRAAGGAGAELTAFFKEGADGAGFGTTVVPETDALKLAGFTEPVPNVPELMIYRVLNPQKHKRDKKLRKHLFNKRRWWVSFRSRRRFRGHLSPALRGRGLLVLSSIHFQRFNGSKGFMNSWNFIRR